AQGELRLGAARSGVGALGAGPQCFVALLGRSRSRLHAIFEFLGERLQLPVGLAQNVARGAELAVALDRRLAGAQKQIEDLPPAGGDDMFLSVEKEFESRARLLARRYAAVRQRELYALQEV